MFLVGLLFGPLHHYVYGWLQNVLPKRDFKTITKKILFDQVIMSPICILSFFYGMGFMERKSLKGVNEEISKKFVEVYVVRKKSIIVSNFCYLNPEVKSWLKIKITIILYILFVTSHCSFGCISSCSFIIYNFFIEIKITTILYILFVTNYCSFGCISSCIFTDCNFFLDGLDGMATNTVYKLLFSSSEIPSSVH